MSDNLNESMARPGAGGGAVGDAEREALEYIANPLGYIQRDAKRRGLLVDGDMALALANDAGHLREIARRALAAPPAPAPAGEALIADGRCADCGHTRWLHQTRCCAYNLDSNSFCRCESFSAPAPAAGAAALPYPVSRLRFALDLAVARTRQARDGGGMRVGAPRVTLDLPLDVAEAALAYLTAPPAPGAADARAREEAARFEGEDDEYEADKYDDGEDDGEDTAPRRAAGDAP